MKANKLFRKLALSGVALGAAAVTLTATTFAWYTSNTEADVSSVTGATEAKGSDSLFISTAQTYTDSVAQSWSDYVAEADPLLTAGQNATITLKPVFSNFGTITKADSTANPAVTEVKGRAYNKISKVTNVAPAAENDPWTSTVDYATEEKADFFEFVFRVRSADVIKQNPKPLYFSEFKIVTADMKDPTDSTKTISSTQLPLAFGEGTGITANKAYGANLMKALKLDVTSKKVDLTTDQTNGVQIPATGVTTRLKGTAESEVDSVTTYGLECLTDVADTNIGTANAVGYYNKVMGTYLAAPQTYAAGTEIAPKNHTSASSTKVSFAELPVTQSGYDFSVVEVRFVLYLDGWDNYCYDVMQGQTVDFSFQISTNETACCLFNKTSA